MLDCCKKNKWFYFGLTIPSMLLYVLALAGPLLLGTLPASFYNWNLIKGNKVLSVWEITLSFLETRHSFILWYLL